MNKKPLLQVDSSKVSGIHKLYEDITNCISELHVFYLEW
jgi:hypothetical protein